MSSPNVPGLKEASQAIQRWSSVDDLVTKALRRAGYGGDYYGISYPGDLDYEEAQNSPLADGFIRIYDLDTEWDIEEGWYLELLIHACLSKGLNERAKLLERFRNNPQIAEGLVEADAKICNKRWKDCVPFLIQNGWTIEGQMVVAPNKQWSLNSTCFDGDLDVMLRKSQRIVAKAELSGGFDECHINAHRTVIKALNDFFDNEAQCT